MIRGGYYLKARKIQESAIAHAPPHVREIWDWLLKECNHKEKKVYGMIVKRGQCVRSYKDIQNGLAWFVGYRKHTYSRWDCEGAMKWLRKATMIATRKTTRGLHITVLKYSYYQDPQNYERHIRNYTKATRTPQHRHTINKNEKNEKNDISVGNKKTPTGEMIAIFTSIYKETHKGTPLVNRGKDGAICKALYRMCLKDQPDDPLGLWRVRVRVLIEEKDINSIGGIKSFWNSVIPKKTKSLKGHYEFQDRKDHKGEIKK